AMWLRFRLLRPIGDMLASMKKYDLKHSGSENAPVRGPFILVANHQTKVDVFAIGLAIAGTLARSRLVPWAKVEIGKGKEGILGWILWRFLGTIPIDREESETEGAIEKSLNLLKRGRIVCVFPEGTRYPNGELGPFRHGVANLARATPVPILPAVVYHRKEDGGIQVNIGKPFFMPDRKFRLGFLRKAERKAEGQVSQQIDTLKKWSAGVPRDSKGMKMIAGMVKIVTDAISRKDISFSVISRLAEAGDNRVLREKVFELLPRDWKKVGRREPKPR
ncbi:MAG: 1-acyl-sn-glycerol-3-phosphate acyltransferase, partial [Actinobacteria bacterium]|nr:1-acyl-sn-glycerol-3-phosphate acyltransferase [Actinomycetota bacterium]